MLTATMNIVKPQERKNLLLKISNNQTIIYEDAET